MNNLISVCKHPCHTKLHPINLDRTLINLLKESKKRLRNYGKPSDLIGKPQDTYDKIITSIGDKLARGKKHRKNLIKANKTISHLKDTISKLKEEYSNKK